LISGRQTPRSAAGKTVNTPNSRGFQAPENAPGRGNMSFMNKIKHLDLEGHVYFITTCTFERERLFISDDFARTVIDTIIFGKSENWYYLLGYVVMPDHLHLLIAPKNRKVPAIMMSIKGYTSRKINALSMRSGKIWQDGYIDFPMNKRDAVIEKINYIEQNPIRAGLVSDFDDYPYSSALNHDILDWEYLGY
jgi:putative transposase